MARHAGAPNPAAGSPQRLDHSVLVEGGKDQAAGEEVTRGDALQTEVSICRCCEAAVPGANVAHPQTATAQEP